MKLLMLRDLKMAQNHMLCTYNRKTRQSRIADFAPGARGSRLVVPLPGHLGQTQFRLIDYASFAPLCENIGQAWIRKHESDCGPLVTFRRPRIFSLEISGPKVVLVLLCKFSLYLAVRAPIGARP